jgi:hypothetical protein
VRFVTDINARRIGMNDLSREPRKMQVLPALPLLGRFKKTCSSSTELLKLCNR